MKRTDAVLGKVALAASLGIAASAANAVPVILDFSGTVTNVTGSGGILDESTAGQLVTGRIVIETEGMTQGTGTGAWGTNLTYAARWAIRSI